MKKHFGAILILLFLTLLFNLSVVLKPTAYIPGFFSTEESYVGIWDFWKIKYSYNNNLNLEYTKFVNYPFGMNLIGSFYLWESLNRWLSIKTCPRLTYNIQVFCNLFFSAVFLYFLVLYLTRSRFSALISGFIFSFSPQHFARIWQHLGISYFQWIPLILIAAIMIRDKFTKPRFILVIAAILLLFLFDWSIMYLGVISLWMFIIYVLVYKWRIKFFQNMALIKNDIDYFKKITIAGIISLIILSPQLIPFFKSSLFSKNSVASAYNAYQRPFEDLFSQSAKPLGYLLPSTEHPVFGKFTRKFVGSPLWGESYTEHQLYLGWTTIILALYAVKRWRRKRELKVKSRKLKVKGENYKQEVWGEEEIRNDFYIGFFILLAVVAWLFSQPPWWQMGKFRILLPSFFMYKILPMYRAYCRFGIVVLLAMAVLAGYGLKFIIAKCKTKNAKVAIAALCCGLILFEFWNNPFTHYIDLSKYPAVYDWLKTQPDDVVIAEYPMIKDGVNEKYKFYQTVHHKKLINGAVPGMPGYQVKLQILDLGAEKAPFILKYLGAEYVIVHTKKYEQSEDFAMYNQLKEIRNNPDLQLVKTFGNGIEVYRVK